MKTAVRVLLFVFFFAATAATAVWAQEDTANAFLTQKYGWAFGIKQDWRAFRWSWNIVCHPDRVALPENGKNVSRNWICRQEDDAFWTVVMWRLPSVSPEAIEKSVFNGMANRLGYGKIECVVQEMNIAGASNGTVKDCSVPLRNATFYVSFYHFEMKVPPYVVETNDVCERNDTLAFTIFVQNTGHSTTPQVKDKLRELVLSMKSNVAE
jgi:hypothetical protein